MTRVSRRGPVSGSRPHPDTGDPWQVAAYTNAFCAMADGEVEKGEATQGASFGRVNEGRNGKQHGWVKQSLAITRNTKKQSLKYLM